jgi:hypothetical protein
MERDERMIAALRRERAAYVARGNEDRVRQVDEQLKHYGAEPEAVEETGPAGRSGLGAQQSTADGAGSGAQAVKSPTAAVKPSRASRQGS